MVSSSARPESRDDREAGPKMADEKALPAQNDPQGVEQLVKEFLNENPTLAAALATFEIAQEEYRKSLMALTSVKIVTGGATNREA